MIAQQRLRAMLESSPLCTFIMDESYKVVDCNQMAVSLFEFNDKHHFISSVFEIAPKFTDEDLYSGGSMVLEKIQEAFEIGYTQFEWTAHTITQKLVPSEWTISRVKLDNDNFVIIHIRDLSDFYKHKEAENNLKHRLQIMLDSSPYIITVFDKDGMVIDVNQPTLDFFELSTQQDFSDNFWSLSPEYQPNGAKSKDLALMAIRKMIRTGKKTRNVPWMHQTLSGEMRPIEVTLTPVKIDGEDRIITHARDLREQNEMMAKLKHREKLLSTVNQAASVLLATRDIEGFDCALILCLEMLGLSLNADRVQLWRVDLQEDIHLTLRTQWLSKIGEQHPQLPPEFVIPFGKLSGWETMLLNQECFNGPISNLPEGEREFLRTQGGLKSVVIIPVFMQDKVWGIFTIDDCENERVLSNEEMDIIRTASLMMASAYTRAEQAEEQKRVEIVEARNREKSKFLARMSHEIRTPITSVIGVSEIQLQDTDLSPRMEEAFGQIHTSGKLLLGIINDILDLSKIEAGKMELADKEYSVASAINDIAHLHLAYLGDKNIKFNIHVDPNLPDYLIGDIIRVEQIIGNLLSNAFKYTESGAVDVFFKCYPEGLEISVHDTGSGMTVEQQAMIYEEFIRFHEGVNVVGTGLGMSIVSNLVRMLDAEIDLESEPGVGTTVIVRVPQKTPTHAKIIGKEASLDLQNLDTSIGTPSRRFKFSPEPMPYGRILVVDDTAANLYVAKGLLAFYDLTVETCDSGYEAVKKIEQGMVYDIVFMDYMMPGQNGTETMHIMREKGYTQPIVALTANALIGMAEEFIDAGYDDYISKPIQPQQLNKVLQKFVRDKQPNEVIEAAKSAKKNSEIENYQANSDLQKQLKSEFVRNHKNTFANITAALNSGDTKTAHLLAHTLKGIGGLIQEPALTQTAEKIERLLADKKIPGDDLLSVLGEETSRVLAAIGKIEEVTPVAHFDKENALVLLDELHPLLTSRNASAHAYADKLRAFPETAVLVKQIKDFNFIAALQTLDDLRYIFA
ncbi:MAG: response regulator [Defluviitaleaceae bacterium]|nr:response regulator [Defluviitaleaceae bacterium]